MPLPYDSILLVSFGGPERRENVLPFLERVLRGRRVPRERMLEVAEHYYHFGGISPINEQNRRLLAALHREMQAAGHPLPLYWGNRNWHPFLADTIARMAADRRQRALALVTSAYSSYSSCRQYRENIADAQQEAGAAAPVIDKLRVFFNHPGFVEPMAELVQRALSRLSETVRPHAELVFTAHSIPAAMASGSSYEAQLREASRLIAERAGDLPWSLVYQSRSGPPNQPWLEPDVGDYLRERAGQGLRAAVVVPVGFLSDHMEVLYDLDIEVRETCREVGLEMVRAATIGSHPRFVRMIRELIEERILPESPRLAIGTMPPSHDVCPPDCCLYPPPSSARSP